MMSVTIERLRDRLLHDPSTGVLRRKNGRAAFFTRDTHGYLQGRVDGVILLAHRVVWALHFGSWPEGQIDHINGVRDDNRIANLRVVNHTENARNAKARRDSTSGVTGVNWHSKHQKWMARIGVGGKQKTLGYFADLAEAVAARKSAESTFGYHPNHGRPK